MFRVILLCAMMVVSSRAEAQVQATTSEGRSVLLFPDGTWKFGSQPTPVAAQSFSRSTTATSKVDVWGGRAAVHYNPVKWRLGREDSPGRTNLEHRAGDAYATIIAERLSIPFENLPNIAITNARQVAPDVQIASERMIRVNGKDVLELKLTGTYQGIAVVYLGYYYSSALGTIQILTYTGANLLDEYMADFREFLNGFVVP